VPDGASISKTLSGDVVVFVISSTRSASAWSFLARLGHLDL
jgi:hypothetical protein